MCRKDGSGGDDAWHGWSRARQTLALSPDGGKRLLWGIRPSGYGCASKGSQARAWLQQ